MYYKAQKGVFSMEDTSENKSGKKQTKRVSAALLAHVWASGWSQRRGSMNYSHQWCEIWRNDFEKN